MQNFSFVSLSLLVRHLWVEIFNSQYQFFLYETITKQGEKGKTFGQIAEWSNKKGNLSVRGKKFKGDHVHSIVKKKRLKDAKLKRDYPDIRSDFFLGIFDKTLVNIFSEFSYFVIS